MNLVNEGGFSGATDLGEELDTTREEKTMPDEWKKVEFSLLFPGRRILTGRRTPERCRRGSKLCLRRREHQASVCSGSQ